MKVLIICSGNAPAGQKFDMLLHHAFIYEQMESLKKLGVDFDIFFIKGKGIIGYVKNIFYLSNYLKTHKYNIIHAHGGLSGFIAVLQFRQSVVITFHGSDINLFFSRIFSNIASLFCKYRIFVSSKLVSRLFIKPGKDYSIIPCGVDLNLFALQDKYESRKKLGLDDSKEYILFSSYFDNPIKNYSLAKKVIGHFPDVELIELKNKTRNEVNDFLNAVDCLLLTSHSEGSPQVIKEAMAVNCPIVSVNVGEVEAIVAGTENSFVTPANESELVDALKSVLKLQSKSNGRERITPFDNDLIAKEIFSIYYKLTSINTTYQRCRKGIWDTTVPGITFDMDGISNYYYLHQNLLKAFPRDVEAHQNWQKCVEKIKQKGKNKRYDCIIGVSGGTDSSYLMHLAVEHGLRPLAVNLDNGWNSDISVKNIKKLTTALNIDLETYVIDYEEVKDILCSQIKAGLPWIDGPTDYAIVSILYEIASREKIKYILTGADFRSEGKQPTEWTYTDKRQIKYIHHKFGKSKLKTYPLISFLRMTRMGYIRKIKLIYPFNFVSYQKKEAQKILNEKYGWDYYGGHHHENTFTKFVISYWLPEKFKIDKRIITLSAQVLSGEISRDEALELISKSSYNSLEIQQDKEFVLKKLGLSAEEFEKIWQSPNKSFMDYPSNYRMIRRLARILSPIVGLVLPQKPKIFYEMEARNK